MKAWLWKVCGGVVVAVILTTAVVASVRFIGDGPDADLAPPGRTLAAGLVRLDAPEGSDLLFESEARAAFLPLIAHFETQKSQTHCGLASIVMVLNALEVPAPTATYGSYRVFTQDNVLNGLTDSIISNRAVARKGMSIEAVARVLEVYGVAADTHLAGASSLEAFRKLAVEYLSSPGRHVIVNYSRSVMGQEGVGHISPLGAYDADSDRFLILDVSRYKAPAVWVSAEQLFRAMAEARSATSAKTRGFLLIRAPLDSDPGGAPVATAPPKGGGTQSP